MWQIVKLFLYLMGLLTIYIAYHFFLKPLYMRYKYSKYPNVYMTPKFYPFLGDIAVFLDNMKQNKFAAEHYRTHGFNKVGDVQFALIGNKEFYLMSSLKAIQEFYDKIPMDIDRGQIMQDSISKITLTNGLETKVSNQNWKIRRTTFTKKIAINHSSKYIPIMVEQIKNFKDNVKIGSVVDFSAEAPQIMFFIISKILFGKDLNQVFSSVDYISHDGSVQKVTLGMFFGKLMKDLLDSFMNPIGTFFPFLNKYNLVQPYSRDKKNIDQFKSILKEFLTKTTDTESVYSKLCLEPELDKDEIFIDLLTFLMAGTDTSAHLLCSTLYLLKKNPDCYIKLMDELKTNFPDDFENMKNEEIMNKLEQCDYLNFVIKESLRYDPPAYETIDYKTINDVNICNVPIKKGNSISINVMSAHMDPDQWHEPFKYIPERFDPTHEYFKTPSGKNRLPVSHNPFSTGLRNCAGQTLAKLESKILLAYFLLNLEYTVDKELMDHESMSFAMISQFKLKFTIDGIK